MLDLNIAAWPSNCAFAVHVIAHGRLSCPAALHLPWASLGALLPRRCKA